MKCQSIVKCKISCRIDLFNLENDLRAISSLKIEKYKNSDQLSLCADARSSTLTTNSDRRPLQSHGLLTTVALSKGRYLRGFNSHIMILI